jgi:8-oxo-dGTP pyrophosphatase MutT (NUDIX family)
VNAAPSPAALAALRQQLAARAAAPRPAAWPRVVVAGQVVGLARPDIAHFLAGQGFTLADGALRLNDEGLDCAARSALLGEAAFALRNAGLTHAWRDELLDVRATPDGPVLAALERAVCRSLGVATLAVHMNALAAGGGLLVARRSARKKIDPGLWDNLVGGMVPAGESPEAALAREAWEEAGLRPGDYTARAGSVITVDREVPEGWMCELIQVYDARLADGVVPANQDGEVDAIERRTPEAVLAGIAAGEFTLEAALATLDWLDRAVRAQATGART